MAEAQGESDNGSGVAGVLSGPDDSESGDVDEEYGSGESAVVKGSSNKCAYYLSFAYRVMLWVL